MADASIEGPVGQATPVSKLGASSVAEGKHRDRLQLSTLKCGGEGERARGCLQLHTHARPEKVRKSRHARMSLITVIFTSSLLPDPELATHTPMSRYRGCDSSAVLGVTVATRYSNLLR